MIISSVFVEHFVHQSWDVRIMKARYTQMKGKHLILPQSLQDPFLIPAQRYINCYSNFSPYGWSCSLCGKSNTFKAVFSKSRYQV